MELQSYFDTILAEQRATLSQISDESSESLVETILQAERIFVAGAGRSGLQIRGFAMRLMHMGFQVHVVGEITTPSLKQNDLLLIGSGSGSTGSLVVMAEKAHQLGAKIALITIRADSPIGRLADIQITIPAPTAKLAGNSGISSIQPMGTLFEQSMGLLLDTLIVILMARTKIDSEMMFTRHANLE